MPTSITQTAGASYVWSSFASAWSSGTALIKTWADAKPYAFVCDNTEAMSVNELCGNSFTRSVFDTLAFVETAAMSAGLNESEAIAIAETYVDQIAFYISVLESLGVSERVAKQAEFAAEMSLKVSDLLTHLRSIDFTEQVSLSENFSRAFIAALVFSENIALAEGLAKSMGVSKQEVITVLDEFLRKANAVISDILLAAGEISQAEFEELLKSSAPPGFDKFKPFLAGDYEYQEALFKEVMTAASVDRPRLSNLAVSVDVPDVTDRGQATVGVGPLIVTFGRRFLRPPEVAVTLRSTTASGLVIPRVTAISATEFTVECRDALDNSVEATISWIAHGF